MKLAKHIMIARTEGPEAGLAFYLQTPASARHPQYAEITKRRTPKTQLAAYCSLYGDRIGSVQEQAEADGSLSTSEMQQIAAIVLAGLQGTEVVEVEQTVPATVVERGKKKGGSGTRLPKAAINVITRTDAWLAGGADPKFQPKNDGDSPANNGQLYRLNMLGKIGIIA